MEASLPDETSSYAEDGTRLHEYAAALLKGERIFPDLTEEEEEEVVQVYVDYVRREADGGVLWVEERIDFSHVVDVPASTGTADAIILLDQTAKIIDLKTGRGVKVDAEDNPQAMLYALGALELTSLLSDVKIVKLVIVQPRLDHTSEWEISVDDLIAWGKTVKAPAQEAVAYVGVQKLPDEAFQPTEHGCRFCRAKAHCPALAAHVEETIGAKFEDLGDDVVNDDVTSIGLNRLSVCMASVGLIEDWCKGIRARVEKELLAGNAVDGFKIVQGRKGARKWSSEKEAEAALKTMKLKVDQMYDYKLISPTTAEKLAKQGVIGKRQWPALQQMITQADGGLSVAPASDPRPAFSSTASASDFEDLT